MINLDKSHDRLGHMRSELGRQGIEYERFPAVYGKVLTAEERSAAFDSARSYYAMRGHRMTDGEIGIALSHVGIYRKMIEENIPVAMVFEDDVGVADGFRDALSRVESFCDVSRPQVYQFSQTYNPPDSDRLPAAIRRVRSMCTTCSYLITLPAAKAIYRANYPVITISDGWRRWSRHHGVELYRVFPTTVVQLPEQFKTDNPLLMVPPVRGIRRLWFQFVDWWLMMKDGR